MVIKDISRKYPKKYENTVATLCENSDILHEPEVLLAEKLLIAEGRQTY